MKVNTQQKVGMVVAAVALGLLGVDRFVLGTGGPASASAQASEPGLQPLTGVSGSSPAVRTVSLAGRLESFAAGQEISPSGGMPDLFGGQAWEIRSVFGAGERGGVRIGTDLIRVGGEFRGASLVRVERDGATFSKAGREFRIPLQRPELLNDR